MASSEPGRRVSSDPPIVSRISARIAAAASWSPRARSSMTRSSIETGNVTPAAFTTWRSIGESSQGRWASRVSGGVFATSSSTVPMAVPRAAAAVVAAAAGSADSVRARIVGNDRRDVDDVVAAQHDDARAGDVGHPCPPDQRRRLGVVGKDLGGVRPGHAAPRGHRRWSAPVEDAGALLGEGGAALVGVGGREGDGLQVALVADRLVLRHVERGAQVGLRGLGRDGRPARDDGRELAGALQQARRARRPRSRDPSVGRSPRRRRRRS